MAGCLAMDVYQTSYSKYYMTRCSCEQSGQTDIIDIIDIIFITLGAYNENLKTQIKSVHEKVKYPCSQCSYQATTQKSHVTTLQGYSSCLD